MAAGSAESLAYFAERRRRGELVVTEMAKFDLESYTANYDEPMRTKRLMHIAALSPPLAHDALRTAITAAKAEGDTRSYVKIVELLAAVDPSDSEATLDAEWMEKTTKTNAAELDRINQELRGYKNNLIKESIRVCSGHLQVMTACC